MNFWDHKFSSSVYILILLAFSGCASIQPKTVVGPDGTPHLLVSCGSIEACYSMATEACGGKYQITNTTNETSGFGGESPVSTSHQLLVKCQK
jgi:hypothetical protein